MKRISPIFSNVHPNIAHKLSPNLVCFLLWLSIKWIPNLVLVISYFFFGTPSKLVLDLIIKSILTIILLESSH